MSGVGILLQFKTLFTPDSAGLITVKAYPLENNLAAA